MKTSWKYKWAQIKSAFGASVDVDVLAAYQHKFPRTIRVEIHRDKKYLTAIIKSIDDKEIGTGFATEGRDENELIEMINDAVQTYLDFPPEVCAQMPLLLPKGWVERKKPFGKVVEFSWACNMHYKTVKKKTIIRYIVRLGFSYAGGKSHDKYVIEINGKTHVVIIPRHRTVSPGVVNNITEIIVNDCGFDLDDVKNNLK
jgi:predicted RNA binding protein YcfA (HicA-like mRNA interferase family)